MKACHPSCACTAPRVEGRSPPQCDVCRYPDKIECRVRAMAMVCPQCNGSYEQSLNCPTCGVRLLYESRGCGVGQASADDQWLHTPLGRVVAGIFLAQGLAYGLRMLCTAGVLVTADEAQQSVWSTLYGLVL